MKTNKCPKCNAHNTLKSQTCGNCGADITMAGKAKHEIKSWLTIALIIGAIALFNMFQK